MWGPARSIDNMRVPRDWRGLIEEGRLLVLSPFPPARRRPTATLSFRSNDLVVELADRVFIAHVAPGGRTEALAQESDTTGKPLLTQVSLNNVRLVELGSDSMDPVRNLTEFVSHGA